MVSTDPIVATSRRARTAPLRPIAAVVIEIATSGRMSSGTSAWPKAASAVRITKTMIQKPRKVRMPRSCLRSCSRKRITGVTISMPRVTVLIHEDRKIVSKLRDNTPAISALAAPPITADPAKRTRFNGRASNMYFDCPRPIRLNTSQPSIRLAMV